MESKIFIDVDSNGHPMIRVDYKHGNGDNTDVRDKLVGRFLFDAIYGARKRVGAFIENGHDDQNGTVAFIRLAADCEPPTVTVDSGSRILNLGEELNESLKAK